jgi:hypothetical protein
LLVDEDEPMATSTTSTSSTVNAEPQLSAAEREKMAAETAKAEKAKLDDLFLKEFGRPPPKKMTTTAAAAAGPPKKKVYEFKMPTSKAKPTAEQTAAAIAASASLSEGGADKIVITKTFDFAGEKIRVTEQHTKDSTEVRRFERQQRELEDRKGTALGGILDAIGGKKNMGTVVRAGSGCKELI